MQTPYSIESGRGWQGRRFQLPTNSYVVFYSRKISAGTIEWKIADGPFDTYVEALQALRKLNAQFRAVQNAESVSTIDIRKGN